MTTPEVPAQATPPPVPTTPWTKEQVDALLDTMDKHKKKAEKMGAKIKELEGKSAAHDEQQKTMMVATQKEFEKLQKDYVAATGSSTAMAVSDPFKPQTLEQAETTMPWFREIVTNAASGKRKKRQDEQKLEQFRKGALADNKKRYDRALAPSSSRNGGGKKPRLAPADEDEDEEEEEGGDGGHDPLLSEMMSTYMRMRNLA